CSRGRRAGESRPRPPQGGRGVEGLSGGAAIAEADEDAHRAPPGGHVPDQGAVRPLIGGDRTPVRGPGPFHRDPFHHQGGGGAPDESRASRAGGAAATPAHRRPGLSARRRWITEWKLWGLMWRDFVTVGS